MNIREFFVPPAQNVYTSRLTSQAWMGQCEGYEVAGTHSLGLQSQQR
jgi:hypothetical protein